ALHSRSQRIFRASTDEALIRVLLARLKYDEVKRLCEERLQTVEDNKFLYRYYMDLALVHLGLIEEGLRFNAETVELAFSEGNKYSARSHRVELLVQGNRPEDALAECDKLLKEFPRGRYVRDTRFKMATVLSRLRRHAESEKVLRALLEDDPN